MGGKDKGLLPYKGKPLIQHVLKNITKQVDTIMINANRNQAQYEKFGHPVIADGKADYSGPLAGMLAGLKAADTNRVLFVPCDSPKIPSELVERLSAPWEDNTKISISVALCEGHLQPVFAMLHIKLAPKLKAFLDGGGHKIDRFYWEQGFTGVPFADCKGFANINTPEELEC